MAWSAHKRSVSAAVHGLVASAPYSGARPVDEPREMDDGLSVDDDAYDEYDDDDEGDYSDTLSNYSSVSEDSLTPIRAYGHSYHGSGRLLSPNDVSEARRMALQHQLFQVCLDGQLVHTKLPASADRGPFHVLDVGAGSGLWACDMAQRYPQADILGIDLSSALLPKDVPPNVTFEIADATEPWPPRLYDFIHMRNLVGGGVRDWAALLSDAFAHLKPGGQLEFTEVRPRFFDVDADQAALRPGETPEIGAACQEYEATFARMCRHIGVNFDPVPRVGEWLADMGAEAVRERMDWVPVKSWGNDPIMRKKGDILSEMVDCGLENWTLMLFGLSGWEEHETRALLDRVLQEIQDPMLRSYVKVTFITARKPLTAERLRDGR